MNMNQQKVLLEEEKRLIINIPEKDDNQSHDDEIFSIMTPFSETSESKIETRSNIQPFAISSNKQIFNQPKSKRAKDCCAIYERPMTVIF